MSVQLTVTTADWVTDAIEFLAKRQGRRPVYLTSDEELCLTAKLYSARCQGLAAERQMSDRLDEMTDQRNDDEYERLWPAYQLMSLMSQDLYELVDAR